jgi:hypothetical protein
MTAPARTYAAENPITGTRARNEVSSRLRTLPALWIWGSGRARNASDCSSTLDKDGNNAASPLKASNTSFQGRARNGVPERLQVIRSGQIEQHADTVGVRQGETDQRKLSGKRLIDMDGRPPRPGTVPAVARMTGLRHQRAEHGNGRRRPGRWHAAHRHRRRPPDHATADPWERNRCAAARRWSNRHVHLRSAFSASANSA